jgi:cell division protein FtsB
MTRLSFLIRREWLSLIFAAVLTLLGLNAMLGPQGPRDLDALRSHREALAAERAQLVADNAMFGTNVQKLRSDRRYIEREIRLELGYARPDELVYKFAAEPVTDAPH